MTPKRYPFAFTPGYLLAAAPLGVSPPRAFVSVDEQANRLIARYGPWVVRTSLDNVADAQLTGPYGVAKTIGPAHLSFKDHGLTMASNRQRGVCITFHEPVRGIEPTGRIRHPGLTVTVADCKGLIAALRPQQPAAGDDDADETEYIVLRPEPGGDPGIVPALYADKLLARAEMLAPRQGLIRFSADETVWAYPSPDIEVVDGAVAQVWHVTAENRA